MFESSTIVLVFGLLAQLCFGLRQIFQWWASEKEKTIQSPSSFWIFSIIGAVLFLIYGVLRLDFAIVLGQFLNFYIYCRNLFFKGIWSRLAYILRIGILTIPAIIMGYCYLYHIDIIRSVIDNSDIDFEWFWVGTIGYLLFTIRFIYQWYISERDGTSKLPVGFFVLSIIGSLLIISYGIYRADVILIFGYMGGLIVYIRNLMIHFQNRHQVS